MILWLIVLKIKDTYIIALSMNLPKNLSLKQICLIFVKTILKVQLRDNLTSLLHLYFLCTLRVAFLGVLVIDKFDNKPNGP